MNTTESIVVPKILSITHPKNVRDLAYFSIGEILNKDVFGSSKTIFRFELNIVKFPNSFLLEKTENFSTYFKVGDNDIYYERKYAGLRCRLLIKNINSDSVSIYINKTYLRTVKFRMDSLFPLGAHLMDLFLIKIISQGDLIIHGASLYNKKIKNSFLIIAPPDTGKTYTTANLIEKGYGFLGEDLSYYNKATDSLYCVPLTSTWGHHFSSKIFDIAQIPFLGWFFSHKKKIVTDLFGKESIIESAPLQRVYLIEKSTVNDLKEVSLDKEIFRKIMTIQRNEFSYFKNMLLRACEYITAKINIDNIMEVEKESMFRLLKSKRLFLVRGSSHAEFYKLIYKNEEQL